MNLIENILQLKLEAPREMFETDIVTLNMMVGGCGPTGSGDCLIPDNLLGLDITSACAIHDFEYATGDSRIDRRYADERFYRNMKLIVDTQSISILKPLRYSLAWGYYEAVRNFGHNFFNK